jgi:hypothetical protein
MKKPTVTPIEPTGLELASELPDLRRDLHIFVDYVRNREIKRAVRSNGLSKADTKRLIKLLSDINAEEEFKATEESEWLDFVDRMALKLGFVNYDTKGVYAGYTSNEPSFPDNYIEFDAEAYARFLAQSPVEQEQTLLNNLVDDYNYDNNEFLNQGILGRLTPFSHRGCAIGVMPTLNFARARRFLLDLLATLEVGVWYSTASLVAYLKQSHPFFLIPKKPAVDKKARWDGKRYGNFYEGKDHWATTQTVPDDAPDGFERVEGRYLERFLEGIPLLLGYVEVAYQPGEYKGLHPSRGMLLAFRTTERLGRALRGENSERVTVQPTFEIHVESDLYPAATLAQLTPLTQLISADRVIVLKLDRQKVTEQLAQVPDLDVADLLTRLSGRPLPQNVAVELQEWSGHVDNFVLYTGFGLYEGDDDLPLLKQHTVESITPSLHLVREAEMLFAQLEAQEQIPLRIHHTAKALARLPEGVSSLFAVKAPKKPKKEPPKPLTLLRQTRVTLHFPDEASWAAVRQGLLDARCPVEADQAQRTLTYAQSYSAQVEALFAQLKRQYAIKVEEIAP